MQDCSKIIDNCLKKMWASSGYCAVECHVICVCFVISASRAIVNPILVSQNCIGNSYTLGCPPVHGGYLLF